MIERVTDNYRRIKRLAPNWELTNSEQIFYLVETENGEDVGVMCFHPCDQDGLLMHVSLGEKCRGVRAAEVYHNAFSWIFEHTDCKVLRGRIPSETRHARVMARHVGGQFDEIDVDGLRCYSIHKDEFHKTRRSDG